MPYRVMSFVASTGPTHAGFKNVQESGIRSDPCGLKGQRAFTKAIRDARFAEGGG